MTNIGNKAPNEKDTNTRKTNEWEVDESQLSGNGVGDLHVNISDLHDKFGDDFGCDDEQYFDEFGDVVDDSGHDRHDGVSVLNADVEMEQITTENEGNPIDLTHEIVQTNTSDLNLLLLLTPELLIPMSKLSVIRLMWKMVLKYLKATAARRDQGN